jgi:uncharacterized protein (DUF2252 family)
MKSNIASSKIERRKQGKALREKCPRTLQADWKPRSKSQDIIRLLEESDADRIAGLIPVKYQRMSASPFTFFRGTAIIQARDLANARGSGIIVQACGDCHLANFGGFASPERVLVFDINDFDETLPGPWEWDVKRLGASLILAARDRNFSKTAADEASASGGCVVQGADGGIRRNESARHLVRTSHHRRHQRIFPERSGDFSPVGKEAEEGALANF